MTDGRSHPRKLRGISGHPCRCSATGENDFEPPGTRHANPQLCSRRYLFDHLIGESEQRQPGCDTLMSAFIYNLIAFSLNVQQLAPELSWPGPGSALDIRRSLQR
jgi:hypothetical protein